jgi:ATP-dependent helicase HrpB
MQVLPIDSLMAELLASVGEAGAAVLEAPPGAGKTTRVPFALFQAGLSAGAEVIVAEPRRLAARMAAERVASELGERIGERIGYRVRFEDVGGRATRVYYVTEGVLLRRLLSDPELRGVGAVVLDEFHERHLETDLLLSLLANLRQHARPDLKLLVMSATLDAEPVARFLGDCPRLRSEGRLFPCEVEYLTEPDERPLEKQVVSAVRDLLGREASGDVLVFLPGAAEIRRAQSALEALAKERDLLVVPLHGDLSMAEQSRAIASANRRKVVLSTNVAESSVTIEGVTGVVDSGLARVASHSPWTGLPELEVKKISRASAIQRAGRAGRVRPGRALRLYTKGDFGARPEHDLPEISRADLTEALLVLHGAAATPETLPWLTAPPAPRLAAARELLDTLGALDAKNRLTETGRRMLELPLHPRLARVLIEGDRRGVPDEAALIAALLAERDVRARARADFSAGRVTADTATGPSDVLDLVDAFELARSLDFHPGRLASHGLDVRSVEAVRRAEQKLVRRRRQRPEGDGPSGEQREAALLISILTGFVDRLARRRKTGGLELLLAGGSVARLAPESVVRNEELMVAVAVDQRGGRSNEGVVRIASAIRAEWLLELYSERLSLSDELSWNVESARVERASRMSFGTIVLDETRSAAPPSPEAGRVLSRAVLDYGAQEFLKSDALRALAARLALLAEYFPKSNIERLDAEGVLSFVSAACEDCTSFAELRRRDIIATWCARLGSAERRLLDEAVPETVKLPGGRRVNVNYEEGKPPWIESRLQDFFGMADGPKLCSGRVPVTLHLLAPNARAVQVTSDLSGFWQRHYPGIRRELMRRYPRHSWPEDGRNAEPPKPKPPRH